MPPVHEHDPAARRRAAEVAARAAEVRASAAAAEAKAAIAAAARAAELADVAAQAVEQADAAVRAAAAAEARAADRPRSAPVRRLTEMFPVVSDTVAATDGFPDAVVPAPRPRSEPAPGGRAARRRAETADTTVFAAVPAAPDIDADDAPETEAAAEAVPDIAENAPAERPTRAATRRRAAARTASVDKGEPAAAQIAPRRRLFRRPTPPVLAAAAAGGVLALTGMLFASTSGNQAPAPAAVIESAPITAPVVPVLPSGSAGAPQEFDESLTDGEVDPLTDRASTYLRELRAAGVPTSRAGVAETEAAELVCGELQDGVSEERIARALPASLPTVSRAQAAELVEIARDSYCG